MGVDEDDVRGKDIGAGDQGMMFGFACNDTPELMPMPIALAHRIINRITELRQNGTIKWLRPDSKSQVTIEYEGYTPVRIDTVVVSTQHDPHVTHGEIVETIKKQVIEPVLPRELVDGSITYHINPTGKFVIGGPHGDSGVTGRKIIVDTYGGMGRHGGGAFSGKDPTKVDRSAAYMARHVAKNIVAAGLAERCEIQLAYAIGVSEPVSIHVDTQGTGTLPDALIAELVKRHFRLNPAGIIKHLDLRRPIYRKTASGGHFGAPSPNLPGRRPTRPTSCARPSTASRLRTSPEHASAKLGPSCGKVSRPCHSSRPQVSVPERGRETCGPTDGGDPSGAHRPAPNSHQVKGGRIFPALTQRSWSD